MKFFVFLFLAGAGNQVDAQYKFFTPVDAFAIELSLEDTELLRLPMYRNAVSSLIVSGDFIIGGTSASNGLSPFLFAASISQKILVESFDIDHIISGQKSIQSGFCKANNNVLYAGTIPNFNGSGHLISIEVDKQGNIKSNDLGIPVPDEGIFSLTINVQGDVLFGITAPTGFFFSYDIHSGETIVYNDVVPASKVLGQLREFSLKPQNYLSRSLITDNHGKVYGSFPVNNLFCFDPETKTFEIFNNVLPEVWGRHVMGQIDAWAKSENGTLYGGNAGDGQLFEFDPNTKLVKNLGKPTMMNRLRGLTFGVDGKLYGISGAAPGYAHLFSYDPIMGFTDLGNPEFLMDIPGIEGGINWRGFQLGSIVSSEDGRYIVIGEDEALSQILVFPVLAK